MNWNCKNRPIEMDDKIESLLKYQTPTVLITPRIKKKPLNIDEREIFPTVIGKPFNNPFEIYTFYKKDKILKVQTYPSHIIYNTGLEYFNNFAAFCNGENHLYISGGEKENKEINNKFWDIDLINKEIKEPLNICPKKNHSMIFIPGNYVFLVGGNDTKTIYYDIKTDEIFEWADLNIKREEPALQRVGRILYCFDNIKKLTNEKLTFEKTDLTSDTPVWQIINPEIDNSFENFNQKFFGVGKDFDDNIIFLGGNIDNDENNELKNYKFSPFTHCIEPSKIPYQEFNFKEKTFLPYNKNIEFLFPDFNRENPELVFYVKNKNKFEKMDFKKTPNPLDEINLKSRNHPKIENNNLKIPFNFDMPKITIPEPLSGCGNLKINIPQTNIEIQDPEKKEINLKTPNIEIPDNDLNIEGNFKIPNLDEKIDIKGPEVNLPKGNIELNGPNINLKEPNLDLKGPNIDLKAPNLDLNPPKLDLKAPNLDLNPPNLDIKAPNIDLKPPKLDLKAPNLDLKDPKVELPSGNISLNAPKVELPNFDVKESKRDYVLSGTIPGTKELKANINTPDIKLPTGNINVKGPNIKSPNYELSGNLPGAQLKTPSIDANIKGSANIPNTGVKVKSYIPDFELSGIIPGTKKLKKSKTNIPTGNIGISGNLPNANIKVKSPSIDGNLPGVKIDTPKIKGTDININAPNIKADADIKVPDVNLPNTNLDLNVPNIKGPDINLKAPSSDLNINGPNLKVSDYGMSGVIPGFDTKGPKIPSADVKVQGPNIKGPKFDLSGSIPGVNIKGPKVDLPSGNVNLNADLPKGDVNIKGPSANLPKFDLSGSIPGVNIKGPKVDLPSGNVDIKTPNINAPDLKADIKAPNLPSGNINIKGPKIDSPNFDLSGSIPGISLKGPKVDLPSGNVNLNGPKIDKPNFDLSGSIPGVKIKGPKVDLPSGNINLNGPNINTPNLPDAKVDLKGPKFDLSGSIPGVKIKAPKVDLPSGNVNINADLPKADLNVKNPDINIPDLNANIKVPDLPNAKVNLKDPTVELPNFNINANLPDVNSDSNMNLKSKAPGMLVEMPQNEINVQNYKLTAPNIKTSDIGVNVPNAQGVINQPININNDNFLMTGIIPGIKSKNNDINVGMYNPRYNVNPHENIPVGKPFHGNVDDPKYNINCNIKGSRLVDRTNSLTDPTKEIKAEKGIFDYRANKIVDEKNAIIQDPITNEGKVDIKAKIPNLDDLNLKKDINIDPQSANIKIDNLKIGGIQIENKKYELTAPSFGIGAPQGEIKISHGATNLRAK